MLTKDDISDSNLEDLDDDIDYDSIEIDEWLKKEL
jgi:hypothetical protein